ncbi:MAG: hypothetical protein AB1635_18895 [Acidobacteriota bacterium]
MAKVLRHGRDRVTIDEEAAERAVMCEACGAAMTHHAEKAMAAATEDGAAPVVAVHACGGCGGVAVVWGRVA